MFQVTRFRSNHQAAGGTLSVGGKLVALSIATVSATLVLVGLLFQLVLEEGKRAQAWRDIEQAVALLDRSRAVQTEHLAATVAALAARESVRAVAHLVSSYEDPAHYLPQLFDSEKRGLANALMLQLPLVDADALAVFGRDGGPIAFGCLCPDQGPLHGFGSVVEGRPRLRITRTDTASPGREPLLLSLLTPSDGATPQAEVVSGWRMTAAGLLQFAQAPIASPIAPTPHDTTPHDTTPADTAVGTIGVVVAGRLLDGRFIEEMRQQTGLSVWMLRLEESQTAVDGLTVTDILMAQPADGARVWPVRHPEWQLGAMRHDLPGGSVLLLFGRDTVAREPELAAFQASAVAALVIVGLIVIPLTLLAGRRVITRPLLRITRSLPLLWRGEHISGPWLGANDEFGALARTLNELGDAITARERDLAASRAHYQQLYDRAPLGYATLDADSLSLLDANQAFRAILAAAAHADAQDMTGQPILALCGDDACAVRLQDLLERLMAGGTVRDEEIALPGRDGQTLWLSLSMDRDGSVIRLAALDVSMRKQAEHQVMQTLDALSTSHAELEQFARIAAHDLREPSRLVVNFAQLLQRQADRLDEDDREHLTFLIHSAQRMYQVVEDVIDYTRAGTLDMPFTWVDSNQLVATVVAGLSDSVEAGKATVTIEPLPMIYGNQVELRQVFEHLIRNAIKFAAAERLPQVRVRATQGDGEWVFAVEDNGIGVASRHFQQIFGVFRRLHSREAYPGTGIGLAICKRIVEHHKGRIWIESEPGQGSTFLFTIPIMVQHGPEAGE